MQARNLAEFEGGRGRRPPSNRLLVTKGCRDVLNELHQRLCRCEVIGAGRLMT